jgi:seryl-tRNA synthetase
MLPIKYLREHTEEVKKNITYKGQEEKIPLYEELLEKDKTWRQKCFEIDGLRARRNTLSEEINKAKKNKQDASSLIAQAKELPAKIKVLEEEVEGLNNSILSLQRVIPNIVHPDVPQGKDDAQNVSRKKWGEPRSIKNPVNHAELAEELGVADFESSARVAGSGFYYLEGDLALLNQALIRLGIEHMVKKGYTYVETPLMVRNNIIDGTLSFAEVENMI